MNIEKKPQQQPAIPLGKRVKDIWFLKFKCPGLPIYEFEGGEIAVAFYHNEMKVYFYYTEAEMIANLDPVKDAKEIENTRIPFKEAKDEIIKLKQDKAF